VKYLLRSVCVFINSFITLLKLGKPNEDG